METPNTQLVSTNGDRIIVMIPKSIMTKEEALVHAAWIVAIADTMGTQFLPILAEVQNT